MRSDGYPSRGLLNELIFARRDGKMHMRICCKVKEQEQKEIYSSSSNSAATFFIHTTSPASKSTSNELFEKWRMYYMGFVSTFHKHVKMTVDKRILETINFFSRALLGMIITQSDFVYSRFLSKMFYK